MKTLSIIIPAYNEERYIGQLLEKIVTVPIESVGFRKEIILVDDGSNDRTFEIAQATGLAHCFRQESNLGKGRAVQRGIRESSGDYVLVQDADLEYDPMDYLVMLKALGVSPGAAIYGSRTMGQWQRGQRFPFPGIHPQQGFLPWLAGCVLSVWTWILYRVRLTDTLTAYKLYPRSLFEHWQVKTCGFETDHELTAKLVRDSTPIIEVPISYAPRSRAEGKKIGFKDGWIALWTLFKFQSPSNFLVWFGALLGLVRLLLKAKTVLSGPLWPDVSSYQDIAMHLQSPFATASREPLWIWMTWVFTRLLGPTHLAATVLGCLMLGFSAVIFYEVLRKLELNAWVRALALCLFMNNGLLLEIAVQGTRDGAFLLGVLLLTLFVATPPESISPKRRLIGLVVATLLTAGIRSTGFAPVILLLLVAAWRFRKPSLVTTPLAAWAALMVPYFMECARVFGDPFHSSNIHAVWWRNYEFTTFNPRLCTECGAGGYEGNPTTWIKYIFGMHPLVDVLRHTVGGGYDMFFGKYLRTMAGVPHLIFVPMYLVGLAAAVTSRNRWILLIPVLFLNLLFFTVHLKMDNRLFSPLIPFLSTVNALGIFVSAGYLYRLRRLWYPRGARKVICVSP